MIMFAFILFIFSPVLASGYTIWLLLKSSWISILIIANDNPNQKHNNKILYILIEKKVNKY